MTNLDLHYVDPRLVALYDIDNPIGPDTYFYVALATELGARTIIDLGCGTGLLTRELAIDGRHVTGVDPAAAMLAVAREHPRADRVQWIEGDSSALGTPEVDIVLMTGNVAQVFLEDAEWSSALRDIYSALRPAGHLAFESRNPADRPWERWTRDSTYEQIDSPYGPMECWIEVVRCDDGLVRIDGYNVFMATGEALIAPSTLRFRTRNELSASLVDAGFTVEAVYGDWKRGPVTEDSNVLVFVARK